MKAIAQQHQIECKRKASLNQEVLNLDDLAIDVTHKDVDASSQDDTAFPANFEKAF